MSEVLHVNSQEFENVIAQNDVVLCTDKVVKKFCMASTNDEVIKFPVP